MSSGSGNTETYVTETVYATATGLPLRQTTTLNGKLHSPPTDEPSEVLYDEAGRIKSLKWHIIGRAHRKDGPSTIVIDPDSGVHTCESFYKYGNPRPAKDGPVRVYRDGKTNSLWHIQYEGDDEPIVENVANGTIGVPDYIEP